jgi:hypothetical protein
VTGPEWRALQTVYLSGSTADMVRVLAHLRGWIEPLVYAEALHAFSVTVESAKTRGDDDVRVPLAEQQATPLIRWLLRQAERMALHGDYELADTLRRVAGSGQPGD